MADTTPQIPQTVQDIMNAVYSLVDDDPTSALTQDAEYTSRLNILNLGILKWGSQDVLWKELWTQYTFTTTISTSQTYTMSGLTNFLQPGSLLYLTNASGNVQFVDIIKPEQAIKYSNGAGSSSGLTPQAAFITGNASIGWTLNLTWVPSVGDNTYGCTPSFYYYKSPTRVSATTDVPEMSDPNYLIWYIAAQKQLFNNRTDLSSDASGQAQECMDNMRIRNEMVANYQDNTLEDVDLMRYNDSMGF